MEMEVKEVKKEDGKYDEWELKNCADKVLEVAEYKADPKKWAAIQGVLAKKKSALDAITSLDGLKAKAKAKIEEMAEKEPEPGDMDEADEYA